jgi:hypothetical protein
MTISSTNRVAGPYAGDGSTATFPFTFKVFSAADLDVATLNTASGAIATLALTSDYSVRLNTNQDTKPGRLDHAQRRRPGCGADSSRSRRRWTELQGLALVNGGGFFPDVINAALDKVTILIQQLQVQLGRAVQAPFPDTESMQLPAPALRAGKLLGFDSAGNLQLITVTGTGGIVLGAPQTASGTVNGVNTQFTFTAPAGATPAVLVYAGGVFQDGATDYGTPVFVSGTTWRITFVTAPNNGPIKILILG